MDCTVCVAQECPKLEQAISIQQILGISRSADEVETLQEISWKRYACGMPIILFLISLGMCKKCGDLRVIACSRCKGSSLVKSNALNFSLVDDIFQSLGAQKTNEGSIACSNCQGTKNCYHLLSHHQRNNFSTKLQSFGVVVKSFASRKSVKKSKKDGKLTTSRTKKVEDSAVVDKSSARDDLLVGQSNGVLLNDNLVGKNLISSTPREVVLQAYNVTSGLILALGLVIRQVSQIAFIEGLPVVDCSSEVSFIFETWHLELIIGLVVLISSSRYLLLQMWPDFAESSEAANQQIFGFRNALVQRLLRDLVSNVNGNTEKNLSSTSLCNEACIIEPDDQFPESCTRPDLLPFLIKPQSTRKKSRKHNTATTHAASGPERKQLQAHNVSDNAEFSITRKENQKNHTGEDCQVDIKVNSLSLAVKLNGAVEVANNSFSIKDDSDLESLRFANSLKEDVALSQERKLVGSEDHRCTSPVTGLSKEEEHIDTLLAADTLGSNSSEADKDETGKTSSREFKSVKTLDLYVPDSLDILQDNVSDSALKHKKASPCQIKNEQDAPGLVFSEDMVRSSPLENEVDTYTPNGNSERSNDDSAEQDFANSMMTLLLPQALPLLKKTSGRKRKKVRTSESSFSNGDVRLNLATTKSSEESHGMHTYNKLSSGEPKTGTCAEGSLKDREGQTHCLSTAPCFESENLENIKSVIPDSLEDTSYQTPSGSAANKIHLKEKSENQNDQTILPGPPKDFPSSEPASLRQTNNLPIQVENTPNCAIPNLRLADDLPCSGSAHGVKVASFTADTEHFEKVLPATKGIENIKKGRSNNEFIQYHCRNRSTGKKLQNSSRDVKDVNPIVSGNSVYTSEKEVDVIKTSDSRMGKISTSMEMPDLHPTSKFRGPLSESIVCRNPKDGCVPEAETSLTTEVDQVCASADSSTRKISLWDESKLDEQYQVLSMEICAPRSTGMISQVQAVDDHAAEDKEIKDVDDDQADANIDSSDSSLLFQERERSFFSNDNVHGPDKNAVDLGFHPQLMSVTSSHQDSVNLLSHIELNQKHLLPNQHTSPKTEFNRTSDNFVELVGCYVQPAPILSVVLSTQGDDIHISVLCGILANRVRTIFIYKVPLRDPRKGYPVFLGYTSIMLPSSKYTFCGEVSYETTLHRKVCVCLCVFSNCLLQRYSRSPYQFIYLQAVFPLCRLLLGSSRCNSLQMDNALFPRTVSRCYSAEPFVCVLRDRSIHCSCSLCTTVCFDENAIQIIHVKLGYVSLVAKLKTDDSVLSILVCEPSHLVALEKNGRLQVWAMNSTWSDRVEEFILPTVDHMFPCIMEIKRIPNYPSLIIGHNGFGDFGLWYALCCIRCSYLNLHMLSSLTIITALAAGVPWSFWTATSFWARLGATIDNIDLKDDISKKIGMPALDMHVAWLHSGEKKDMYTDSDYLEMWANIETDEKGFAHLFVVLDGVEIVEPV
ncbi:hypothetical protein IFM89_010755, partial [Coptis chinensis]